MNLLLSTVLCSLLVCTNVVKAAPQAPQAPQATTDSVEIVLKGNQMEYLTNGFKIQVAQNESANDLAQLLAVNATLIGLWHNYQSETNIVLLDQSRVTADLQELSIMQSVVANDSRLVGDAQTRLSIASSNLQFIQMELQAAIATLNSYSNSMLPVLDRSTSAAIQIIGEIQCTAANQYLQCNVDDEGVLQYWATNGCRITTGFVCSASTSGYCMCPVLDEVSSISTLAVPPNTPRDYVIWSTGTLRSVVVEIRTDISGYNSTVANLQNQEVAAEFEFESALTSYQLLVSQLQSDQAFLASVERQLSTDQGTLQADEFDLGVAQEKYNSAVHLRDMLAARYANELPVITKSIAKLQHDNTALIQSSVIQASTIECQTNTECQDGPGGSLTFFAQLGCHTNGFVCYTSINSCGC